MRIFVRGNVAGVGNISIGAVTAGDGGAATATACDGGPGLPCCDGGPGGAASATGGKGGDASLNLGGSAITAVGVLALLHLYELTLEPATANIHDLVFQKNWFLPIVLLLPTIVGMIMQNKLIKHESKWEL